MAGRYGQSSGARWGPVAVLALLAPVLACGGPEPAGSEAALTRAEFIDVVSAVREAELAVEGSDSAQALFEARRDSILAAHGTTEAALRAFLERHSGLAYMEEVWDSIAQRLKRPLRSPREIDPMVDPVIDIDGADLPAKTPEAPLLRTPR